MSISMEIPSVFKRYTGNQSNIEVRGTNIGDVIKDFVDQYPEARVFLDKEGNLDKSYDIYINGQSVFPLENTTPVKDGDKLNFIMIINGG